MTNGLRIAKPCMLLHVYYLCIINAIVTFPPDLYEEKFIDCKLENTTFLHNKRGCHLDIGEENDVLIYLVSFLGSLAVLPGNIISALFMEKIGRVKIIGELVCIGQSTTVIGFYDFNCVGSYNGQVGQV